MNIQRLSLCALLLCVGALAKPETKASLGSSSLDGVEVDDRAHATFGGKRLNVANEGGMKFGEKTMPAGSAQLQALNNQAQIARGNGQQLSASKQSSNNVVVNNGKGATATGTKNGNTHEVKTSGAKGAQTGSMQVAKDAQGDGHDIALDANHKQNLDVQAHGAKSSDSFDASNSAIAASADPTVQTKTEGKGELSVQNKKKSQPEQFYLYEIGKSADGNGYSGKLQDKEEGVGRVRKTWLCTGSKVGESVCVDQNGKQVGKVLADEQGNTVVYNKAGMPIARGQAKKISDNHYQVSVNKNSNAAAGLFSAEVKNYRKSDCYQEVSGRRSPKQQPIKITKLDFEYNSESNANGTKTIRWPDCFDIVADLELSAAVEIDDLALEFIATVKPLGTLQCLDQATCGRGCYYCHLCEQQTAQKIKVLEHSENNVCSARAARSYTMRATVCPPSSDEKAALCSKFDRSIANKQYWSTNNGIDGKVLVWQRPKNEDTLTKRYFDVVAIPDNANALQKRARDAFLQGIELKYKLDHPNLAFAQLTEEEKFQYYLREYGKEQLLACEKGEVDYNLGGEKVNSDFVIEAVKVGNDGKNGKLDLFSATPCDEWTKVQEQTYQQRVEANSASGGGILGSLLGRFGG